MSQENKRRKKGEKMVGRILMTINVQKGTHQFNATKNDKEIIEIMQGLQKRGLITEWSAQLEKGEQGLIHWQICMKAKNNKRMRMSQILSNTQYGGCKLFQWAIEGGKVIEIPEERWEATKDYCNKEESRMEGHSPLNHKEHGYEKPVPMTDMEQQAQYYMHPDRAFDWQKKTILMTDEWAGDVGQG